MWVFSDTSQKYCPGPDVLVYQVFDPSWEDFSGEIIDVYTPLSSSSQSYDMWCAAYPREYEIEMIRTLLLSSHRIHIRGISTHE